MDVLELFILCIPDFNQKTSADSIYFFAYFLYKDDAQKKKQKFFCFFPKHIYNDSYIILKPKVCIILREISMVYHMEPLILKAVAIGILSINECDKDIKFICIHFFYNAVLIPFFEKGNHIADRCILFLQQLNKLKYKSIFPHRFMDIRGSLRRKIKAETLPCARKSDNA